MCIYIYICFIHTYVYYKWPSALPTPSSAFSSPEKVSGESAISFSRSFYK